MGKLSLLISDKVFGNVVTHKRSSNYSILDDKSEEVPREKINMNNTIGLEDGRWMRIVNVGDGSVIELVGSTLQCKPLDPSRAEFQMFKCIFRSSGRFYIACKYQAKEFLQVWDYLPHRKLLMQKRQLDSSRNTNQLWRSEHVPGSENMYFILSIAEENVCLKNVGHGKQVLIVSKTDQVTADKFAQWKLEQLEPIRAEDQSSSTKTSVPASAQPVVQPAGPVPAAVPPAEPATTAVPPVAPVPAVVQPVEAPTAVQQVVTTAIPPASVPTLPTTAVQQAVLTAVPLAMVPNAAQQVVATGVAPTAVPPTVPPRRVPPSVPPPKPPTVPSYAPTPPESDK